MEKSNNIPIFEQGTKEQKANKPAIEDVCEYFLKDDILNNGMACLLEISRELKMKPGWVSKNAYKYNYRGKGVVSYSIRGKNNVTVSISLADKQDLEKVVLALPDELRTEFLNRTTTHCGVCSAATCNFGIVLEISGEEHCFCSRFNYMRHNPTAEQFKMIERFISIRKDYINSK